MLAGKLDVDSTWGAAISGQPLAGELLSGRELDITLEVIADFADLKAPCFLGRSRAVAELAGRAAAAAGLDGAAVRRAGLVQDVGRVAVSRWSGSEQRR